MVTQIQTVYENPTNFPVVTVCNANPVVTKQGLNFSAKILKNNGIDNVVTSELMKYISPFTYQGVANTYLLKDVLAANAQSADEQQREYFGYGINSLILVCLYGRGLCDFSDLRQFYSTDYGNCYQFNSGYNYTNSKVDVLTASKSEPRNGLALMLFMGSFDDPNALSFSNGAHIFIHNQTDSPTTTSGIDIAPGKQTNVGLSKMFVSQLPIPYNQCYKNLDSPDDFDSFYFRETLKSNYRYRQIDCLNLCEQEAYYKKCNCSDIRYPTLYGRRYCTSLFDVLCIGQAYSDIYKYKQNYEWFQYCPLECDTQQFVVSTSISDFPSDSLAKVMLNDTVLLSGLDYVGKPHTVASIRECFAFVNIYYDYIGYTQISETPSQLVVDLLSSIGGTMGLYLGVSFLSFVEVFELAFELLALAFKREKTSPVLQLDTKP